MDMTSDYNVKRKQSSYLLDTNPTKYTVWLDLILKVIMMVILMA